MKEDLFELPEEIILTVGFIEKQNFDDINSVDSKVSNFQNVLHS